LHDLTSPIKMSEREGQRRGSVSAADLNAQILSKMVVQGDFVRQLRQRRIDKVASVTA
jgi:hypothetical protein